MKITKIVFQSILSSFVTRRPLNSSVFCGFSDFDWAESYRISRKLGVMAVVLESGMTMFISIAIRATIVYSLVDTCKAVGKDPREWMEDVQVCIHGNGNNRGALCDLLSDKWAILSN